MNMIESITPSLLVFGLLFNSVAVFYLSYIFKKIRYTASIMATEAEFLVDLKPPDIEEVKVMSSTDNDKSCNTPLIRHYAEKLDEMTIRSAIDNLFLRNTYQGNKVR